MADRLVGGDRQHKSDMWTLILLALLVGVRAGDQNGGIIGGHKVAPHSKPWMACLTRKNRKGEYEQACGGALISTTFVLTAAHCSKSNFSDVEVVLGIENTHDNNSQKFQNVKHHYPPNGYNSFYKENDIVLLELTRPAELNNSVKIIALPLRDRDVAAGTVCNVAGWGWTENGSGTSSDMLMEVNVTVLHNAYCDEKLPLRNHMKGSMLCAGKHGEGKDAGPGDSGGPLVCNGRVEGIVSHKTKGSPPSIYTRVSKYLEWIKETAGIPG